MKAKVAALALVLFGTPALAATCETGIFEDVPYTACIIDPAKDDVRLALDADGARLGTFRRLEDALSDEDRTLVLAMNAGMYHPDRAPVGLYIEDGVQVTPLVTRAGPGNFGMLPNGVLCLGAGAARVIESRAFAAANPDCAHATQSGPMLVIDGALHPRFIDGSDFTAVRNGAGVRADGTLVLAISDAPVNFHTFARLFRDALDTPNALYLDGRISRLWAPMIDRRDGGFPMGPMIAVTAPGP